jgi:hypothetical protein
MIRGVLLSFALALGFLLCGQPAGASTFRPIPLATMVDQSSLVIVGTPISRDTHWAMTGTTARVVTDVTVEVAWTLRGNDSTGQDIVIRTLGGTVGDLGQIVYGEARLVLGQSCLLFLMVGRDGAYHVFGMAQGQYPLQSDDEGNWRINASPGLEGVLTPQLSVVGTLTGRRLMEVPALLESSESAP